MAGAASLWDQITSPTTLPRAFWQWSDSGFQRRTYGELVEEGRRVAEGLRRRGVGPGSIVPAVITNGPSAIAGVLGIWFAGGTLASLPIIARGMSIPAYVSQLEKLCSLLGSSYLLAEERFAAFMPADSDADLEIVGYNGLIDTADAAEIQPPPMDETVFIQFSSGTTGDPRGVELTGLAIDAHLTLLAERVGIDPERDIGYTWLPLSHDMGFFGCGFLAWYSGMEGIISTPERFLQSPRTWFDDCAEFGATVTAGPPAALDVAARLEALKPGEKSLALRLCLVGAEMVGWEVLAKAARAFEHRGLTIDKFTPAYGLAEATLAVTVEDLNLAPAFVDVDPEALANGQLQEVDEGDPGARRLVSAGSPLAGVQVRTEGQVGEILIESPSLATGYFGQPSVTNERFQGGEFRTGDLGFLHEGRLFVAGRNDDLLIVGGRNVYTQDLEQELSTDSSLKTGNCALVDLPVDGRPRIALVAEVAQDPPDVQELANRLRMAAMERSGLPIDDFMFLTQGAFPKTPSGKVQRYRCRELLGTPEAGVRLTL